MFFYFKINQTFNLLCVFCEITANGSGIAEGGELEAQKLNLLPLLAKPFFYLLMYKKEEIKNGFCGIELQMFNLALQPRFWQYFVSCSFFYLFFQNCHHFFGL